MKILILGSEGFIGSHLVNHFIDIGWHVSGCDLIEKSSERYVYQKISLLSADIERLLLCKREFFKCDKVITSLSMLRYLSFIIFGMAQLFFIILAMETIKSK